MQTKQAFTLIELLVVIAILSLLSTVILAALNSARESARVSQTVAQVNELRKALVLYYHDTGGYPPTCQLTCTETSDPLLNALGVPGWGGPYIVGLHNLAHQWGGHIGFTWDGVDRDGDGIPDAYIMLDDDAPGTNSADNSGTIPIESMEKIDAILDDGDLATGRVYGNGNNDAALGELVILVGLNL